MSDLGKLCYNYSSGELCYKYGGSALVYKAESGKCILIVKMWYLTGIYVNDDAEIVEYGITYDTALTVIAGAAVCNRTDTHQAIEGNITYLYHVWEITPTPGAATYVDIAVTSSIPAAVPSPPNAHAYLSAQKGATLKTASKEFTEGSSASATLSFDSSGNLTSLN